MYKRHVHTSSCMYPHVISLQKAGMQGTVESWTKMDICNWALKRQQNHKSSFQDICYGEKNPNTKNQEEACVNEEHFSK